MVFVQPDVKVDWSPKYLETVSPKKIEIDDERDNILPESIASIRLGKYRNLFRSNGGLWPDWNVEWPPKDVGRIEPGLNLSPSFLLRIFLIFFRKGF